jgi:DNA repair protein RadA/Sms
MTLEQQAINYLSKLHTNGVIPDEELESSVSADLLSAIVAADPNNQQPDLPLKEGSVAGQVIGQAGSPTSNALLEVLQVASCDAADLLEGDDDDDALVSLPLLGQEGYFIEGWSHLLASYPRVGKTELLTACCGSWLRADKTILYLTEESRQVWRKRIRSLGTWPTGMCLVFGLGAPRDDLLAVVGAAHESVVVIDTIRNLLGMKDENDNSEVARVINPWVAACRAGGKTLILSHHMRKGGGDHGEGIAGGHALLGAVDVGLELMHDQNGPHRRRIRAYARLVQPPELLYERYGDGSMQALGDPDDVTADRVDGRLLAVLGDQEDPQRFVASRDILAGLDKPKPSREQLRLRLVALAQAGKAERDPPLSVSDVSGKRVGWRLKSNLQPANPLSGRSGLEGQTAQEKLPLDELFGGGPG